MKKSLLRQYAKLIAVVGGGIKKGQEVVITAQLDQPEFVCMLVQECYRAGAKRVTVEWAHQPLAKLHAKYQKEAVLSEISDWQMEKLKHQAEVLPVRIYLESEIPTVLRVFRSRSIQMR